MAVSKAIELGVEEFVIPTAGNAGSALAAYAARAGKKAHIYMPQRRAACQPGRGPLLRRRSHSRRWADRRSGQAGARNGGQSTAGLTCRLLRSHTVWRARRRWGWNWPNSLTGTLPDVIVYPTGGGTGLVGMWKAFRELGELGWMTTNGRKMVSVQAAGCAPVVKAFARE